MRLLLAFILLFAPATARADALMGADRALELLRAGGFNLYMRHAITDRSQIDTGRRGDRAGQRNLNAEGRAQAAALGEALRALAVPVGPVASSEVFRARDTAEIAFGAAATVVIDVLIADDYTPRDPIADAVAVRALLARPPVTGNAVFVGHIVPFGLIVGRPFSQTAFPEGAIGIVRPRGDRIELVGVVAAETLIRAAGRPTPWAR